MRGLILLAVLPSIHAFAASPRFDATLRAATSMSAIVERAGVSLCATAATLPMEPTAELNAAGVVYAVCEGLKRNDDPHTDAGMERLFNFLTPMGRVSIAPTPPKSGLQGGVTLEWFLEEAGSPALGALIFCADHKILGDVRVTPGSITRGDMATALLEVGNSPLADDSDTTAALRRLVKADDDFLAAVLASARDGTPLPEAPASTLVKRRFWVQMEQERRPPQQGCWLIKEFLPLSMTEFQRLNEGGEEFEGEDTG